MRHSNAGVRISIIFLFPPRRGVENQQSRSHPRCRSFFLCLPPSARVTFSKFATPLVRECRFCRCLLRMCCWRSGFSPPASICSSLNIRNEFHMVNHGQFSLFSRALDFGAHCRCHPSARDMFFSTTPILASQKSASRVGGVEKIGFVIPALVAVHIFLSPAPSARVREMVFSTPLMEYCLFCWK